MKIVFMGTPEFALPAFYCLRRSRHEIVLVVTQSDKPRGRHRRLSPPPVKETAIAAGIPVIQPNRLSDEEAIEAITAAEPDVVVVAAYGKIIPSWLLQLPRYGCINVHASLLPKYRGAAPIQRAIMAGERVTGITIMQMDAGLDTGAVLLQEEMAIGPDDTAGSLAARMASRAADLVVAVLEAVERGTIKPRKQDDSLATLAPKIEKEESEIDWTEPAETIRNKVRGLNPVPGAYTWYAGALLKVWRAELWAGRGEVAGEIPGAGAVRGAGVTREAERARVAGRLPGGGSGTVIALHKEAGPVVNTGTQPLALAEVQPADRKHMSGSEFIRGHPIRVGDKLGRL